MSVITGTSTLALSWLDTLAAGATRISAASIPCRPTDGALTWTDGTAANSAQRFFTKNTSLVATTIDIDLSTAVTSDATVGFTHWREIVVYNDSTLYDLTIGLGSTPFTTTFMTGTTPAIVIPPGGVFRQVKPLGTVGYVVAGATILRLNSGANTIAYRLLVLGD